MLKVLRNIFLMLFATVSLLFVVYFLNIDQKVVAWLYTLVHKIFDRKHVDVVF